FKTFIVGYVLGAVLLLILNRFYLRPIYRFLILVFIFVRELISANIDVVKLVYQINPDIEPGIFKLPIEVKKNWEITLLANLITLTPGTLTVAISDDQSTLFIH